MPFRNKKPGDALDLSILVDAIELAPGQPAMRMLVNNITWYVPLTQLALFMLHEYEALERSVIYDLYDAGDVVIEAGTGIGITGLSILRTGARLVSYDPQIDNINLATKVFTANGFMDVKLVGAALGPFTGTAELTISKVPWDASLITMRDKGYSRQSVPLLSLDDEISQQGANAVHMDVEGAELVLLEGMDLSKINKISMEVHPSMMPKNTYANKIVPMLLKAGFESVVAPGFERCFPNFNWAEGWSKQ